MIDKPLMLKANEPYKSLQRFDDLFLPTFTVVVGPNGSGKSQLLQSIAQQQPSTFHYLYDVDTERYMPKNRAVLLTSGKIEVEVNPLTMPVTSRLITNEEFDNPPRNHQVASFWPYRDQMLEPYMEKLLKATDGALLKIMVPGEDVWKDGPDALIERLQADVDRDVIRYIFGEAEAHLRDMATYAGRQNPNPSEVIHAINQISHRLAIPRLAVTQAQIRDNNVWGGHDAFSANIPLIFSHYRDAVLRNDIAAGQDRRLKKTLSLSEDDFLRYYGEAPWETATAALEALGLSIVVAPPSFDPSVPVTLRFRKLYSSAEFGFSELSAGEQVITRLAFSLLKVNSLRVTLNFPDLLLLDEVDATLHPEMLHRWLGTLRERIVDDQKIPIILTTHSPVTIAMVPEQSIYEMQTGSPPLRKISRQDALDKLTVGLPALSVDLSRRRQVLTESHSDAIIYDSIYAHLKSKLSLHNSIDFLGTGARTGNQTIGSGCTVVQSMIASFEAVNNTSIYGAIDWDLTNKETPRVKVLAHGTHYALENVILDPLLVGCLLLRELTALPGIEISFTRLDEADDAILQSIADYVTKPIPASNEDLSTTPIQYLSGKKTNIPTSICRRNGHDYEDALVLAHPRLRSFSGKGPGKLMMAVVDRVLKDYPELTPSSIIELFSKLGN